jgi:hypothetical protein
MYLTVNQRVPVGRQSEADFIVPIIVDVLARPQIDERNLNRLENVPEINDFAVGRLWAERWELALSEECGYNAIHIGDVSGVWLQVVETLMRSGRRFRPELGIEGFVSEVIFLHEFLLHPEIQNRVAVVDSIIRSLTGINSLVLMQYEQGESYHLEDHEYRDLGFCKIARSNLLIKDTSLQYPFAKKHPAGQVVDVVGTLEHEQWLFERWEKLLIDHPAL